MEQNFENYDIRLTEANVENLKKNADKSIKSHRCNQCDFTSSHTSALGTHLKTHSGVKSNKCNQCEYASSDASNVRTHLKTHSGIKSNKCNQCDYTSSQAGHLRTHLKSTVKKNQTTKQMQPM